MNDWGPILAIVSAGLLLAFLMAAVGNVAADTGAVVAEAEKDGIDLLYAALAALVAGGGGLFLKRPQDVYRERMAQNGSSGASGGGTVDAGHRALDELAEHERQCVERMKAVYARIEGVEARLGRLEEKVGRVAEDISFIRGVLTPTGGKQA